MTSEIIKLLDCEEDLDMGSFVVPKGERGYLLTVAAIAPTASAVEFFVKLRLRLGAARAKRVVAYLVEHPEVLEIRGDA